MTEESQPPGTTRSSRLFQSMPTMDHTASEKLRPFLENLDAQGVELALARAHLPLRELNLGSDLDHLFPGERTFSRISHAVAAFKA